MWEDGHVFECDDINLSRCQLKMNSFYQWGCKN